MSGTSLDGIDLAVCVFKVSEKKEWSFTIEITQTISYPENWKRKLKEAIHFSEGRLQVINNDYTDYLASIILNFIEKNNIKNLDAVCNHGHTILHQPGKGITLQLGNLSSLAEKINQKVVCDFRVQDVAMGGQGAPLVPIGDQLLFSEYDYCLNLGGFANCSFEKNGNRIAYDICPVNIVLNRYAEKLGFDFDEDGKIAASGTVNPFLFQKLNALPFYKKPHPKSLGLEWVKEQVFPVIETFKETPKNILSTFASHIAYQLSLQFKENSSVLITGGGAYNSHLLRELQGYKKLKIIIPSPKLIEYKEALIFGFLGILKIRNEVNCLASVTGAKENHSSGYIYNP